MVNSFIKPISKIIASISLLMIFQFGNLHAQSLSYSCNCDDSLPQGVLEVRVSISSDPGETWTVMDLVNLYTSYNPSIALTNGSTIEEDPMNPGQYVFEGYAYHGLLPYMTASNGIDVPISLSLETCFVPELEIVGDITSCVGADTDLMISLNSTDILINSVSWSAPGAASMSVTGVDDQNLTLTYDEAGSYFVSVEAISNGCRLMDDLILTVTDAEDGMVITGSDYLCTANATSIPFSVTNPSGIDLVWSSNLGTASFTPFIGTPMTGSGTAVDVTFPSAGTYTLSVTNANPGDCLVDDLEYVVQVVDVIDSVQIVGESYACLDATELYTIANPGTYTNLQWSISPMMGADMTPSNGMANAVEILFSETGSYTLTGSGTAADGCGFFSTLDITVPDAMIGSLACNNSVNVSLNNNCILELTPDMILEGQDENNDAFDLIIVDETTGDTLTSNMLTQDQLGNTFRITVMEKCGGNSCWGQLVVEDKSINPLEPFCSDVPVATTCYDIGDITNPVGFPNFGLNVDTTYRAATNDWIVSGFDNCSDVVLSFEDELLTSDVCADPQIILRKWTAVDTNNGLVTTCDVVINVVLINNNSILWPADYDSGLDGDAPGDMDTDNIFPSLDACNAVDQEGLLCGNRWFADSDGNPSPDCTGSPTSNGFSCPNLVLIGYTDQVLPVCGNSRKILRQWTVWDACELVDIMHTQIITLMDNTPPVCTAPAPYQAYTDIHECGADVPVEPPFVSGECTDDYTYQVSYKVRAANGYLPPDYTSNGVSFDGNLQKFVINDIDFATDTIWIKYVVRDACGNLSDDCFTEIELIDNEQPIPACDFNNVITLNQYGYAFAGPATFDDNSWDNCGVYQSVIRRMNNNCDCHDPQFDFLHSLGEFDGHYYYLSKEKLSVRKAFAMADALEGNIAVIDSTSENEWLRERVNIYTDEDYFIGLSGTQVNTLNWVDDQTGYSNWAGNEPSLSIFDNAKGDVHVVVEEDGRWDAERANKLDAYYVIEFDTNCGWSQKLHFCCSDVGEETMVSLKVIDYHGNHNFCMVNVNVTDYVPPTITCPVDVTANCDASFDINDLSQFGTATASDDCGDVTITESPSTLNQTDCGEGVIRRVFTASDAGNNRSSCTQTITLSNQNPFGYADIMWPADETLTDVVCSLEDIDPSITGVPTWQDSFPCSNITYTHTDLIFYIVEGVCQKLVRTWTVVDWCQNGRLWEYNQVIKLVNTVPPSFVGSTCTTETINDYTQLSNCLVQVDELLGEAENASGCDGELLWSYTIDYNNDNIIDRSGFTNDASGQFPYGSHTITWTVEDHCGNVSTCTKNITINDQVAPTPYCHGQIVIPISHTDGVDIWASDLNLGSFDNCPQNQVYFSFEENAMVTGLTLTCADLDSNSDTGVNFIDLWVWDNINSGLANKSVCTVTIILQDNQGVCQDTVSGLTARIEGEVFTEQLEMIDEVELNIISNNMTNSMMIDNGEYAFNALSMYDDYYVTPHKDDNYLNGVSTLDLVLIQRHILGLEHLDSPYKVIAADVDNSESITAIDLIELRKLILGIYDELPNNYSWRFVDSDYTFNNPLSPFPYAEDRLISNLESDMDKQDFVGVKIGDVNNTVTSNLTSDPLVSRSSTSFPIDVIESYTDKGNVRVQLIAKSDADLSGMQFSANYDQYNSDLLAVIPMRLEMGNDHIAWDQAAEGDILVSFSNEMTYNVTEGDILMEFLFKGSEAKPTFATNSNSFNSEAYLLEANTVTVADLEFKYNNSSEYSFELLQNAPNPFKETTEIQFVLDAEGPIELIISDQTGRVIHKEEGFYSAGLNAITINTNSLNTTGILYYQLSTATQSSTRKMIVIK